MSEKAYTIISKLVHATFLKFIIFVECRGRLLTFISQKEFVVFGLHCLSLASSWSFDTISASNLKVGPIPLHRFINNLAIFY